MTQHRGGARVTLCDGQIEVLPIRGELDLATADSLAARGCTAIDRHVRLLLLDLSGLSFCDARGLSALVRIANHANAAGCRYSLIAPRPQVAGILRICGLEDRLPACATVEDALAHVAAMDGACAR